MILSIETSSALGSWALFENGQLLETSTFEGRASSSLIASLEKSKFEIRNSKLILIGVGPGSFGGIRVAIATAQGLARAWKCPILPVRSSSALAWKHRHVSFLGIFADAKRTQYFFTAYEKGQLSRPSSLIPQAETENYLSKCSLALSPDPLAGIPTHEAPTAEDLARHYLAYGAEEGLSLGPIYLHPPLKPPAK